MNRQAFPSIILSVSIVCFFAVALYRRDGDPRKMSKPAGATEVGPGGTGAKGRGEAPSAPVAGRVIPKSPPPSSGRAVSPASSVAETAAGDAIASAKVRTTGGAGGRPQGGKTMTPAVREASDRTARENRSRVPPLGVAAVGPSPATASRSRRGAFTVAGTGERIADVARRVYGTTAEAEGLWRANRDVLRDPDAPIAPGTLLHTPAAPLR